MRSGSFSPLFVVNPRARELTFPDSFTRTRRDHMKYLTLIRAIALLHQHQRTDPDRALAWQELEYIEATPADIAMANRSGIGGDGPFARRTPAGDAAHAVAHR